MLRLAFLFRLRRARFFAVSGEQVVMAKWLGDSAVEMAVTPGGKVFRSEQSVGDVKIVYGGS